MAKSKHELDKICAFCEHAECLHDENTMLCDKYGIVYAEHSCRKFIYDTLKRSPKPIPSIPKLSPEDII